MNSLFSVFRLCLEVDNAERDETLFLPMVAARGRVVRVFPLSTVILACQIGDSSVSLAECARLFRLGYLRRRFFLRTSSRPCVLRPSRVLGPTTNSSDTFRPTPLPNPPSFHLKRYRYSLLLSARKASI